MPEFVKGNENKVCKLGKTIYGLKEAAIIWNREIDQLLKQGKFISNSDFCFHVWKESFGICCVLLYVDDLLISSSNSKIIDDTISLLKSKFVIHLLEKPKKFLCMNLVYEGQDIFINQKSKKLRRSYLNYYQKICR